MQGRKLLVPSPLCEGRGEESHPRLQRRLRGPVALGFRSWPARRRVHRTEGPSTVTHRTHGTARGAQEAGAEEEKELSKKRLRPRGGRGLSEGPAVRGGGPFTNLPARGPLPPGSGREHPPPQTPGSETQASETETPSLSSLKKDVRTLRAAPTFQPGGHGSAPGPGQGAGPGCGSIPQKG